MFRPSSVAVARTAALTTVLAILLWSASVQAELLYQLPAQWPAGATETISANNESMYLRIAEDTQGLLAMNAKLAGQDLNHQWTLYSLARNADVALGRTQTLEAIAERDIGALTGQQVTQADLPADGWLLMQAIEHGLGNRYATAETEVNDLLTRRPQWSAMLNNLLWPSLSARMATIPERQACLDHLAEDGVSLSYILAQFIRVADDNSADLVELRSFVERGPDVPAVRLLGDMIAVELAWLASPPTARDLADQWRDLTDRYGDLAYGKADAFAYEIISRLPAAQSQPLLAEFGRPRLGTAFRLRRAESLLLTGQELEAGRILARTRANREMPLRLHFNLANAVASADSLRSVMSAIRCNLISATNSLEIQGTYTLLGEKDIWGEVWTKNSRENPMWTIQHRLDQLSAEKLPALLALRDSLQALNVDQAPFKRQFENLAAATATEVDLAAIEAEADPRMRARQFTLGHITAGFRGDHDLRKQLVRAEIKTTDDPRAVRSRARTGVVTGDRDLAALALARLDELGEEPDEGLEFHVLAAQTLSGRAAAQEMLGAVNVNTINSISTLGDMANMADYLDLPAVVSTTRQRLEALAPAAYTTMMVAMSDEEKQGENGAAVAILRELTADYPGSQRLNQKLLELGDSVVALDTMPTETFDREDLFVPFGDDLADLDSVRARRVVATDSLQSDDIILLSRRSIVLTGLDDAYERDRLITQVLTRAGADRWRGFSFEFDPSNGVPHVRTARVLTPDGRVLDTDPGTILVRAPEGDDSDVTDSREMFIPLQGVEPGAIIDVTYDMQNGAYLDNTWSMLEFFIANSVVREYVFELLAPADHQVHAVVHGEITTVPRDSVTGVRRWLVHDLPQATDQDNRPSLSEIVPWVGLTTFADWDDVGRSYGPQFWQSVVDSPRLTALADSLTRGAEGTTEKAAALYRYVVEEITPLAVELGSGRLVPSSCDEVLDRGWGDCKDNSHLLLSLLRAADIEARPVLVSTVGHFDPREDLPSLSFFNHMIVQITGLKNKPYCDPLNGTPCLVPLPAMSAGRLGLHLNSDGSSVLAQIPASRAEDHVSDLEVDVRPVGERSLRYEILGQFTGAVASYMKSITAYGDTNITRQLLDRSVGYGVPQGVPISSWSVTDGDCGGIKIAMTYLDTVWAEEGASSASLHHHNEGSVYWELPSSEDRLYDVIFPSNYTARLVLRLHGNEVWTPADHFVPFSVENDFARGTITGKKSKEDGRRLLTITHEYQTTQSVIPRDDYENFRRDAIAYAMFSGQRYDFRRVLDKHLIKEIESYTKRNPDDEGFRLNAAANLLGSDLGGLGEEGAPRREAAMKLLAPLVETDSPSSLASRLVAHIYMKRNQYQKAREVVDNALSKSADDLYLLATSTAANIELERWDAAAENLARVANKTGNAAVVEQYVLALLMLDDETGVQAQIERMRLLGSPLSEQREVYLRYVAAEKKDDLEGMKQLLTQMAALDEDEDQLDLVRCSIYALERRTADSIPLYERLLADNPGSSILCNNLAWSYAICGQNLERALMLSRAASLLEDDPASSRNTYAAVMGRLGKWKEARKIFRELYENDDRPIQRIVNGYFLGLAEVQLGNEDKAREVWQAIVDLPASPKWGKYVRQSLKALDEGGDVAAPVFEG